MHASDPELQFLLHTYAAARNKFKPSQVSVLLVAEAPPESLDRYFYFEDVKKQDSLFLEIMGILYPDRKRRYLLSGRETPLKKELLEQFKSDGFWLLDLSELPCSLAGEPLEDLVPSLAERMKKSISLKTPVILLKTSVYDTCYVPLLASGFKVSSQRIPFPGSGQQRVFRERFSKALQAC